MSWRDEYTERCLPSVVPSGAYPEERLAMADQGVGRRAFREVCGSCGCEFLHPDPREGTPVCPLCGGHPKVWYREERE